jgi:predicted amidohydrolase YtcJ
VTRTLLTGGRVIDGTAGPPAEADVLVEDGRILDVGPGLDGDEAVDVGGRYLLPGLIEHGIYRAGEAIGLLLDRGAWLVPTLAGPRGVLAATASPAAGRLVAGHV